MLAVALTALLLVITGLPGADGQTLPDTSAPTEPAGPAPDPGAEQGASGADEGVSENAADEASRSIREARETIRELVVTFGGLLPKLLIGLLVIALAAAATRLLRPVLRRTVGSWERANAVAATLTIAIWLGAFAITLSIFAGSPGALLGSIGLFGLALSWALQAPIESFTAWLLNSFRGYYRVGDRIAVGDVFGDVHRIDFLNTTVWEAGGPGKSVQGAQPTGAVITFPNSELLRTNVINYTRDFPYVWDEVTVGVANDSDLEHAMRLALDAARTVAGAAMVAPIATYRDLLERRGLGYDVADEPQVYLSAAESWMDVTARYLVPVRERRRYASALTLELSRLFAEAERSGRVRGAYPVRRIEMDGPDGPSGAQPG